MFSLPDNYEVFDASLNDIKFNLQPIFNPTLIQKLDEQTWDCLSLEGLPFNPGCVGLNNLKLTDFANVIVQMLSRVTPLRDFCLLDSKVHQSQLNNSAS